MELLLMGREGSLTFRRGDSIIRIFSSREKPNLGNYTRAFVVRRNGSSIMIAEPSEDPGGDLAAYIVYA
jgi:hypothetical protein